MNQKTFVKMAIMSSMTAEGGLLNFDAAVTTVAQGILSGECPHGDEAVKSDEKAATKYAKAVINNYLKRDKDLNGGTKYVPENPRGPRGDSMLKELNKALSDLQNANAEAALIESVKAAIESRTTQVEAEKGKKVKTLDEIKADLAKLGVAI